MALAAMLPRDTTCWILTDGKAGDLVQCLGVAEALGLQAEQKVVAPRPPWLWLMPWGPVDPHDAPDRPGSLLAPPYPNMAIASGRRAVPYLRALKRASDGRTFTVFLKDPRTGPGTADLIWVPEHDRLRGPNVLVTLTSPHRLSPGRLAEGRARAPALLPDLPSPRAAVLLGGDSRHYRFTDGDIARLAEGLANLANEGASLMVTASRRSPPALVAAVREVVLRHGAYLWDGTGDNPYAALLAAADLVVATADSVNMVGEACVTGRPVLVFEPTARSGRGVRKVRATLDGLRRHGAVRNFQGKLESYAYQGLDSTPTIASAIVAAYAGRDSNAPG